MTTAISYPFKSPGTAMSVSLLVDLWRSWPGVYMDLVLSLYKTENITLNWEFTDGIRMKVLT